MHNQNDVCIGVNGILTILCYKSMLGVEKYMGD